MFTALGVITLIWATMGLILYGSILDKQRFQGGDRAASLNSFGAMSGTMLTFHCLYGIPVLLIASGAHGLWRRLS